MMLLDWIPKDWQDVGAIGEALGAIITGVALIILAIQIKLQGDANRHLSQQTQHLIQQAQELNQQTREIIKTRNADIVARLYGIYSSEEMGDAVRTMWQTPFTNYQEFRQHFPIGSDGDQMRRKVIGFYNDIGSLIKEGIFERDIFFNLFRDSVRIWEKLKPVEIGFSEELKETENESETYFEWLYNQCMEWKKSPKKLKREENQ